MYRKQKIVVLISLAVMLLTLLVISRPDKKRDIVNNHNPQTTAVNYTNSHVTADTYWTGIPGIHFSTSSKNYKPKALTTNKDFLEEFDAIVKVINRYYTFRQRKNISVDYLNRLYRQRVLEVADINDFNEILTEMIAALNNAHTYLFNTKTAYRARVLFVESKYILTYLYEDTELAKQGVEAGWEVIAIDDIPVDEWISNQKKYFGGTDQWKQLYATEHIFMRFLFQPVDRTYTFLSPEGTEHTYTISLNDNFHPYVIKEAVISKTIESDELLLGYIAVNEMTSSATYGYEPALTSLLESDGLILDLRNNGGGNSQVGDGILKTLISSPFKGWGRTHTPAESPNYKGPVVVLIGSRTFSAAESFAFDLFDAGKVFVGEATGGCAGGDIRTFITDGGVYFRMIITGIRASSSGMEMEGTGLIPHYIVRQTLDDYYKGEDTVLNEGIRILSEMIKSEK